MKQSKKQPANQPARPIYITASTSYQIDRLVKASRELHDLIINDESRYQAWQDEADELEQALLPFESGV